MDNFELIHCDGAEGMFQLEEKSVKLVYGSPPYPNAQRNYGIWKETEYIEKISPFIDSSIHALRDDGFLVLNVKANRVQQSDCGSSKRSLVVEKLAVQLEEKWNLSCVDIEIWVKGNPTPTGLRVACQDAYEQILWFSKSPKWSINIDAIRKPYSKHTLDLYDEYEYKARENSVRYVKKNKIISPNPQGALPLNVINCGVCRNKYSHQAVQPVALPEKYIKACTDVDDIVVDPWLGSGTTGEAAITLGRRFIGFDIVQEYIDMSNHRLRACVKGKYETNITK